MEWTLGIRIIAGMFLLRLMVPLVLTLALGYALHRLDEKWHPDATSETLEKVDPPRLLGTPLGQK